MHPTGKLVLIRIVIPEVGIHNGELIVCKVRREDLITVEGLHPSITNRGRGGVLLHSGITTGSGGRDKRVGGRHLGDDERMGEMTREEQMMGKGMTAPPMLYPKD